jgi:hypothetical protein
VLPNPLLGKGNKNFAILLSTRLFVPLASPKVLSHVKGNKNFVIYFAFHSLIRTFAAAKDVFDKYIINIG